MRKISYLLLSVSLLLGSASVATALPILNILDLKSTSLAKITATTQSGVTREVTSLVTMTKANLPKKIIQEQPNYGNNFSNTVDLYLNDPHNDYSGSVYAGILFWSGGFTNYEHWSTFGGMETNYTNITGEATSQLDMRFTISGEGAMIGFAAYKNTRSGLFAFSLFDETDDRILFNTATNGNGLYFDDLYLSDGHTYQLYAFSKIGPTGGESIDGNFDWLNSPLIITVPECSTLLLSITGLCLFLIHRRRSTL
jgi:hypothetical protein